MPTPTPSDRINTPLETVAELPLPQGSDILGDRIGLLPGRQARARQNPFADPVREVTVRIATGKVIRLISNDLDAPASEIADLYKQRWQIELFFKWVKQNLKLRRFLGESENAVRVQIFVALIAYLALRAAYATQNAVARPLAFIRLVRLKLMHRRPIDALNAQTNAPPIDTSQLRIDLCQI